MDKNYLLYGLYLVIMGKAAETVQPNVSLPAIDRLVKQLVRAKAYARSLAGCGGVAVRRPLPGVSSRTAEDLCRSPIF